MHSEFELVNVLNVAALFAQICRVGECNGTSEGCIKVYERQFLKWLKFF